MINLQKEQMQDINGGCEWSWKSDLHEISIGGGDTCMDVYTSGYYSNACDAASSGAYWVYLCLNSPGHGGGTD